jgi:hypothetical protein
MPRQVRIDYEGAIYHVMARGNRREMIAFSPGWNSKNGGAGMNTTLERGWCFGTSEFKEKMIDKLDAMPMAGKYKKANGYSGKEIRDHGERAAREWIEKGLLVMELEWSDLAGMPKMDARKAMLARVVRRHTRMGLEWISATLGMGVRSSVTRAEKELQRKMSYDKKLQKQWEDLKCTLSLPGAEWHVDKGHDRRFFHLFRRLFEIFIWPRGAVINW